MLAAVSRKCFIVRGCGEDAGHLVRHHGRADSGAVDHDSEADRPFRDELRDLFGELRIVDRILAVRPDVTDGVAFFPEERFELLFELESAMVGADRYLQGGQIRRASLARVRQQTADWGQQTGDVQD